MTRTIEERRTALRDRFATWTPMTLDARLDECAAAYGGRPFVITDDVTLTYAEVAEQSKRYADGLVALGVRPGDRVGMLMANYAEFVPLKFAIARAGAIAIPFNFLYRADELGYVLAQSGCSVLITMTSFAGLDYLPMLDQIAPGWDVDADRPGDRPGQAPELRRVIVFANEGEGREGPLTLGGLAELGAHHAGESDGVPHEATEIADLLYTSGSTGEPKGVLVTHDAVQRTAYASALTRAYDDGWRIVFSLPCYHMFGYVEGILSVMWVGGAVIPQLTFSPDGYFAGIQNHHATDLLCVPTMAVAMVESPHRGNYDLSTLQAMLCGSTIAPLWLWQRIEADFGVSEIVTGYGMTECGGAMVLTFPEDDLVLTSTTVGRPKIAGSASIPGTDVLCLYKTADPSLGDILPDGEEGELVSQGPTTMIGYWGKPEQTAEALREGWLHSGDLGRVRPDGYLEVTGRSKELYKSGGELVMPKEIEELLSARDDVSQVFAVGVPDDRWGEIGCVVIVPAPGAAPSEAEILDHCRAHLARFKVPRQVLFAADEELPKTPTGKIQKFRLVEQAAAQWQGGRP